MFLKISVVVFCHFLPLLRLPLFIFVSGFQVGDFPQIIIIAAVYWV